MRRLIALLFLCLGLAACGGGMGYEVAPAVSSPVDPGGTNEYCPSGQQPPCV